MGVATLRVVRGGLRGVLRRLAPLALIAAGCATPSAPFQGRPVLTGIHFVGNANISSGDLLAHIATAPTSGFLFFSKTPRYYDADLFAIDLERIVRFYNQKGFYEAVIRNVEERKDDAGRVEVFVRIEEGRRAYVKQVNFHGAETLGRGELSDMDSALPIHAGDPFDEDDWERAKQILEQQLKERGFAEATVAGKVEVAPDEGAAVLNFQLSPGRRFKFGRVVVGGNRSVSADQIAQATGISLGDRFRPSAMELAQQRVYNLGAFSGVRVGLEPFGEAPVAAVRINVREAPFQTVRVGVGFQTEATRSELPRLRTEYVNRNILGGLKRLELNATVGYAFTSRAGGSGLAAILTPDHTGVTTLSSAQVVVPNVLGLPGLDFISRAEFAREIQAGFDYDEVAGRVSLLYRRGRHSIAPALNFVRFFEASFGGALDRLLASAGQRAGLLTNCVPSCTLTYPEIRYTFDARDNVLEPTSGFFATVDLQQTLEPGSFKYFRIEPEVRAYTPFVRHVTLAGRVQYGALFLEGPHRNFLDSPFTQRFFGGGQNFQRGYAPLRQGPKIGVSPRFPDLLSPISAVPGFFADSVPIGGNGALLVSGELRLRTDYLIRHTAVVFFADASRISEDWARPWEGRLEVAPGIGLRYITPFGPIRVDFAYLLNPQPVVALSPAREGANVGIPTPVTASCNEATGVCLHQPRFAYHITLGEAF